MALASLQALLQTVRLQLEVTANGGVIVWEGRRYPVVDLCLDGLDPSAERAELLSVAAAFEAAVKYPGRLAPGEDLRTGAAALLPKVERQRFVRAYDAVIAGREGELGDLAVHGLFANDLGGGLVTAYVQDEGWKFNYIPRGRVAGWDASPGTVHAVGRSNLYHRAAIDHHAAEVAHGDGYDAARVIIVDEVFYDREGERGIEVAVPGRDLLLVAKGPLDRAAVQQAFALQKYPISPLVFALKAGRLEALVDLVG